uniref:Uncharacterized protein n=1 Tax=Anguilla anguilla TaxID=7936 RepID=A0A0E9XTG7_ANGAN
MLMSSIAYKCLFSPRELANLLSTSMIM